MKQFEKEASTITLVAPYDVASGAGLLVGSIFGVAQSAAISGAEVEAARVGQFTLKAKNADTATAGAKAYWDNTNKEITITSAGMVLVGAFAKAKAAGVTASVLLDGAVR